MNIDIGLRSVKHKLYPRRGMQFALPAQGWLDGIREALAALAQKRLRFSIDGSELALKGTVRGSNVLLRFHRAE